MHGISVPRVVSTNNVFTGGAFFMCSWRSTLCSSRMIELQETQILYPEDWSISLEMSHVMATYMFFQSLHSTKCRLRGSRAVADDHGIRAHVELLSSIFPHSDSRSSVFCQSRAMGVQWIGGHSGRFCTRCSRASRHFIAGTGTVSFT